MPSFKILLLEDDEIFTAIFLRDVSKREEVRGINHVTSKHDAIQALSRERYDVVLCDLFVTDSDGLDTLKALIQVASAVPIIVITSMSDPFAPYEAIRAGAQSFIPKSPSYLNTDNIFREIKLAVERNARERMRRVHADIERDLRAQLYELELLEQNYRHLGTRIDNIDAAAIEPVVAIEPAAAINTTPVTPVAVEPVVATEPAMKEL